MFGNNVQRREITVRGMLQSTNQNRVLLFVLTKSKVNWPGAQILIPCMTQIRLVGSVCSGLNIIYIK